MAEGEMFGGTSVLRVLLIAEQTKGGGLWGWV